MARCSRCGRVYREPEDEQGDHPCCCAPRVDDDWGYDEGDDEDVAGDEARADSSILDTRYAFQCGSGYFGWMLIPDAKLATGGNP